MKKSVLEEAKIEKINEYNSLIEKAEKLAEDIAEIDDALEWVDEWETVATHSINPPSQ